jgi:hypothetical protein
MEHQLWKAIVTVLATFDQTRKRRQNDFTDHHIVAISSWAVLHDRPQCWACQPKHWPLHLRRRPLPCPGTLSRRLRSAPVVALLAQLERRVIAPQKPGLFWMIDGQPLVIGGCSKDRQAGYGRAANSMAKGYKIHALVAPDGAVAAWRLAPMHVDERVMARRLLRDADIQGYGVGDANYDSNPLYAVCDQREGLYLVARRRKGPGYGLGRHKHSVGRLQSVRLTENPFPAFAEGLLQGRQEIERRFGQLVNWAGGLACLPAWVRSHRRVHRWVQAKLVLTALKHQHKITTYAA